MITLIFLTRNFMKKTFSFTILPALIFMVSLWFAACEPSEPDDIIPPTQNILTEDTTGTLGWLTVDVMYYKNGQLHYAPSLTEVHLYLSTYDYENFYPPFYKFYTYESNRIEMGFLEKKEYYIHAFATIDYTDYEMFTPVIVRTRNDTAVVTMQKIEAPD